MNLISNLSQRGKEFSTWWAELFEELPVCEARRKIVEFDPHETERRRIRRRFDRIVSESRHTGSSSMATAVWSGTSPASTPIVRRDTCH